MNDGTIGNQRGARRTGTRSGWRLESHGRRRLVARARIGQLHAHNLPVNDDRKARRHFAFTASKTNGRTCHVTRASVRDIDRGYGAA